MQQISVDRERTIISITISAHQGICERVAGIGIHSAQRPNHRPQRLILLNSGC